MSVRAGVISAGLIALAGVAIQAQQASAPQFTISGTSTVRAWSCPAQGTAKIAPGKAGPAAPGFPGGLQAITVSVPVRAIACDTDLMNDHLREAMNEKANPEVVYQMTQYTMSGPNTAHATGNLTINGVTKPIAFDVRLEPAAQGVHAAGETTIDMTQFSLTPPAVFEGMLKVGKDVRVRFQMDLPAAK